MNSPLSTDKLASYLHTIFVSTKKNEIKKEIEENEESRKVLTIFVNIAFSNNAERLSEQFSKFQNNPTLKNLKFFKSDDIDKLTKREKITIECFEKIYPLMKSVNAEKAYNNCIEEIQKETGYAPYFHARNKSNETILLNAIRYNNIALALILLEEDSIYAEEKVTATQQVTAFEKSLQLSPELTRKFLSCRIKESNQKEISWPKFGTLNNTPLHVAIDGDNLEVINILLDKYKFPIEEKNSLGETALHHACYQEKPKAVKLLIEKKANVNTLNKVGSTPLIDCSTKKCDETNKQLISLLLENKASVSPQNNQIKKSLKFAIQNSNIEALKLFYKYNNTIFDSKSSFDHLCKNLNTYTDSNLCQLLRFLADNGELPEPLETLLESEKAKQFFRLITNGQDSEMFLQNMKEKGRSFLNWQDQYGQTLLSLAIMHNFTESAKLLIDLKADYKTDDLSGINALDNMMNYNRPDLVEYIIEKRMVPESKKDSNHPLQEDIYNFVLFCAGYEKKEMIERLAKNQYIQTLFKIFSFSSVFVSLAQDEKISSLKLLVDYFKIALSIPNIEQWRPSLCTLLGVLECNQQEIASELIKLGATYNDIAKDGTTRLHYLIETHNTDGVAFLLKQEKIDINIKDLKGRTPLAFALEIEFFDIADLLIKKDRSVLSDPEKLQAFLKQVINMNNWRSLQYILKYGSENHKLWKNAFDCIKNEITHGKNQFIINAFFESCAFREQFFELAKKCNVMDLKNEFWEQQPNQILMGSSKKSKNQHWITNQLSESKEFLKKSEQALSFFLNIKNQTTQINNDSQKTIDRILENAKKKIFGQQRIESIQKVQEEAQSEIQNVILLNKKQLEKLFSTNNDKPSDTKNPQEELQKKLLEQQKEIEELKKQLERQKESEKQTKEHNKQLTKTLKKFLKNDQNKSKKIPENLISKDLSETSSPRIIEETTFKFIEPKNNSRKSLIDCIETNCDSLIKQSIEGLNFENIKNKAMGSLKRPKDLENLCSEAGLQKSKKKSGSHGNWKSEQTNQITLSTHEGQNNDKKEIKQVLKAIIETLKKYFK